MFGNPVSSGLTLTKVIGGLSKTLNIANQVIPLYREAKPMLQNAKTILSVLKDVNKGSTTPKKNTVNQVTKKDSITESLPRKITNSPSFFL